MQVDSLTDWIGMEEIEERTKSLHQLVNRLQLRRKSMSNYN